MYLRKFIAGLLAAFMLLSLVPPAVFGDAEPFSLEGGTLTITGNWYPEDYAQRAGVTRIVIGPRVTSFLDANGAGSSNPFREYGALTEITVAANNPVYRSNDGVLLEKDAAGGALGGTEDAPKYWVRCCPILREGVFVLPEDVGGIGYLAFQEGCHTQVYARQATAAAVASLANIGGIPLEELPDEVYAPETPLYVNLTALTLDRSDAELVPGAALALSAAVEPEDATVRDVLWTSSDESVATVSNSGVVTAVASGTAVITAATAGVDAEDRHLEQTCEVFVSVPVAGLSSLAGNRSEAVDVDTGAEARTALSVKVSPANATYRTVTWTSTDPETALLSLSTDGAGAESLEQEADEDADGLSAVYVVPVASGETTVTASCGGYSVEFTLTLQKWVKDVALSPDSLLLTALGGTAALTPVYDPADADNITAQSWESDDTDIATVDRNGAVTAVANGETAVTLTVTASQGGPYTVTCPVKVEVPVERVELDETALTIEAGEDKAVTLKATVYPETAANKTVTWSSSDESVATVDVDGKVTGVKVGGPVWITVETEDGGKTASCAVTVKKTDATKLELEVTEPGEPVYTQAGALKLEKGGTAVLTATLTPDDATNKALNWATSDAAAVRIVRSDAKADENGVANATIEMLKTDANATVTVTSADNGALTQSLAVVCDRIPVERVSLDKSEVTLMLRDPLKPDGETTLTATVDPETATDPSVTWENSASGVVTVTRDSANPYMIHLTASGCGEATILAKGADGKQAACKVTVYAPVTGVTLNKSAVTLSLPDNDAEQLTATVLPAGQADQTVVWTSSKESVATVSDSGVVTAVGPGEAKITATAGETGYKAECAVTVEKPATDLSFSGSGALSVELTEGTEAEDGSVTLYVTAEDATDQPVLTSSNDTVAAAGAVFSRKADGKAEYTVTVTAKKTGTATVTARCGAQTATLAVTVTTPVKSVTLNETSLSIAKTKTARLTATVLPASADNKTVTWTSNAPAVATVDETGLVTGVAVGTATITATSAADTTKTAACTVTVGPPPVEGVALSETSLTLRKDDTATLTATVSPDDTANKNVTWSTSNADVATVSESGVVTAKGVGAATITAASAAAPTVTATCAVTVEKTPVTGVTLNEHALTLTAGQMGTLTATVAPDDATDKTVTWRSDNPAAVEITSSGVDGENRPTASITAKSGGTAYVYAESPDGKQDFCAVTVNAAATGVTLGKSALTLTLPDDATEQLTATVAPEGADQAVTWESSNTAVATVSDRGVVTAVAPGTAKITATAAGTSHRAECTIRVNRLTDGLTLSAEALNLSTTVAADKTKTLTATLDPINSTEGLTFRSDRTDIATVTGTDNGDGTWTLTVTAVSGGSAAIEISSGSQSKTCAVTVAMPAGSVTVSPAALALEKDGEQTLTAAVLPANADNRNVTWTSSDEAVATVDAGGKVTAHAAGTATITATAADGSGVSGSCAVTVGIAATGISIPEKLTLTINDPADEERLGVLTVTYQPSDTTDKAVTWQSQNTGVVTVTPRAGVDGVADLEAVAPGSAQVTVTGSGGTKVCTVTVLKPAGALTLSSDTLAIRMTDENPLSDSSVKATVTAPDHTDTFSVSSSDSSVAEVTADSGVNAVYTLTVTAKKSGTAIITARCGAQSATLTVTVTTPVARVTLPETLSVQRMASALLTATVLPANADNKAVTWSSSDETVATVDENTGLVTGVAMGQATITATSRDGGKTGTCTVTVGAPSVERISLSQDTLALKKGGATATLQVTFTPADAADQTVSWSTSDSEIATVAGGVVTPVGVGRATVTATSNDGGKAAACAVTVTADVTGLTLNYTGLELAPGGQAQQLVAILTPANGTCTAITWSSSDPGIATVSDTGLVSPVRVGSATVTCTLTRDGLDDLTAACEVTVGVALNSVTIQDAVMQPVTAVTLNMVEAADNHTKQLLAALDPPNATDSTVSWSSTDESVVAVDNTGRLTAVGPGSATVTVTAGGDKTASCTVTVERGTVSFDGVTQSPAAIGLTEAVTFTYGPCDSDFTLTQTLAGTAGIITPDTTSAGSVTVTPVGDGKCTLRLSGPRNSGKYTEVSGEWTFLCMNTPVSGVTVTNQPGELLAVRLNNNGGSTSREIIVEGISRTDPAGIDWESRLNISLNANLGELLADGTLVKSWSGNVMTLTMGGKAITYTVVYSAVRWLENGLDNGSANDTVVFVNATGVETGAEGVTIAPVEKIKESALGDRGLDNTGNQYRVDVSLQVDYVSSDDQTLTLNVKPAYRIYPTTGENTGTPLYTGTVTETGNDYVHITVLLDFKPELIQHIHRDGSSVKAEYPEFSAIQEGGKWKVDWWQNTFSEVNILGSVRSGAIRFAAYGGGEILLPVNETDLETALPADRRDGCVFRGWEIEGLEGVYDSLTDEVLSAADGAVLQAEPVFDSDGTLTASIRSASAENGVLTVSTDSNAPCAATLIAGFYRNGQMVAVAARAVTLSGGRDAWTLDIPADASRSLCRVFLLDGSGAPLSESKICGA